jgi:hypothetical protein
MAVPSIAGGRLAWTLTCVAAGARPLEAARDLGSRHALAELACLDAPVALLLLLLGGDHCVRNDRGNMDG